MSPDRPVRSLPEIAAACGVQGALVTDEPQVVELPGAAGFADRVLLTLAPAERPAAEIVQTQMAQLFAAAAHWLERAAEPFLLWIHARGMAGAWDAPAEFRNQFADENDPLPPEFVTPPVKRLGASFDPDEVLGYLHAYAGQVALLDDCLGAFLETAQATAGWQQTLLAMTAPRGYPLGEHRWVGGSDEVVYGEQVHVPCLIRLPQDHGAAVRRHELVQPPDLCASLCHTLQLAGDAEPRWGQSLLPLAGSDGPPWRDRAATTAPAAQSLRTPAWLLVRRSEGRRELYAKPDDRWEANEVASRCQEVVEQLDAALDEFQRATQSAHPAQLSPLPAQLLEGMG
jgi:arylsulfatase A-like enzyme